MLKKMFYTSLLIVFFCGCEADNEMVEPLKIGANAIEDQQMADDAKEMIAQMKEVVDVKAVAQENNIYIAPEVRHRDRFFLKDIRKRGFHRIRGAMPEANVHLSTDKKVFLELDQLELDLINKEVSKKSLKERLAKIEDDMKG